MINFKELSQVRHRSLVPSQALVLHEVQAVFIRPHHQPVSISERRRNFLFIPSPAKTEGKSEDPVNIIPGHFIVIGISQGYRLRRKLLSNTGFDRQEALGTLGIDYEPGPYPLSLIGGNTSDASISLIKSTTVVEVRSSVPASTAFLASHSQNGLQ